MFPYPARLMFPITWLLLQFVSITPLYAHAAFSDFSAQLQSVKSNSSFADEDARLMKLLDVLYDYNMTEFPELATQVGYARQNDRWTDWSTAAIERRKEETRKLFATVQKIKRE